MQVSKLVLGELASNCYVLTLGDGSCVVFDIGEGAPVLLRHLQLHHLTLRAILLTHGHYDHIAGVEQVRSACGVPVYIHTLDASMLTDSTKNLGDWLSQTPFQPIQEWNTVDDQSVLHFGDANIQVLHTPGHTPGSVCWQYQNLLFTGDTLFRLSRGRTDFPGGSDRQMLESLRKLSQLKTDFLVYPGHNDQTTLAFEKAHNPSMRGQ